MLVKTLVALLASLILSGCIEREIYTQINDKTIISHPPSSVRVEDLSNMLKTDFRNSPEAAIKISLYVHCAKCTNAQSRSLGSDFDGYIRITVSKENRTIARAQMDYKGEVTPKEVLEVYHHLMEKLQWNHSA